MFVLSLSKNDDLIEASKALSHSCFRTSMTSISPAVGQHGCRVGIIHSAGKISGALPFGSLARNANRPYRCENQSSVVTHALVKFVVRPAIVVAFCLVSMISEPSRTNAFSAKYVWSSSNALLMMWLLLVQWLVKFSAESKSSLNVSRQPAASDSSASRSSDLSRTAKASGRSSSCTFFCFSSFHLNDGVQDSQSIVMVAFDHSLTNTLRAEIAPKPP